MLDMTLQQIYQPARPLENYFSPEDEEYLKGYVSGRLESDLGFGDFAARKIDEFSQKGFPKFSCCILLSEMVGGDVSADRVGLLADIARVFPPELRRRYIGISMAQIEKVFRLEPERMLNVLDWLFEKMLEGRNVSAAKLLPTYQREVLGQDVGSNPPAPVGTAAVQCAPARVFVQRNPGQRSLYVHVDEIQKILETKNPVKIMQKLWEIVKDAKGMM
jgi:hypothetical protein